MKAVVVKGNCDLEIMEIGEPQIIKDTQMKIHVTTGAICNTTDNKIYATDTPEKDWPNDRFPFILGHECTGRVVELGKAVKGFEIGDRVVYWTVNGRAFADYLLIDTEEAAVGKVNEDAPEDVAAMMEMVIGSARLLFRPDGTPLIRKGDKVAVYGLGPAGLIYHRLARMMGGAKLCGIGRRKLRLEKSLEMGADFSLNSQESGYIDEIHKRFEGHPDVIIDATGGDVVREMIALGAPDARIIAYGVPPFQWSDRYPELESAGMRLPEFTGTDSARIALAHCVEWLHSGKFGLEPIISHRLPISQIARGLDMCRLERDTTLKVIVSINQP